MPMVSKAQRGAMYAAKAGKSTLGIPKSVGEEFVKAGPASSKLPQYATPKANRRDYRKGYAEGGEVYDSRRGVYIPLDRGEQYQADTGLTVPMEGYTRTPSGMYSNDEPGTWIKGK